MPQDIHLVPALGPGLEPRRPSRALRIAMIGPSRHPVSEPFAGGQEALVHALARVLRERGHDVTLFAVAGSQGADRDYVFSGSDWSPSEAAGADRSMPARVFMDDHHEHLRLMTALGGELDGRFDVVHNHSLHHLPVAMAATLRTPVVTTLHTPPTPWLESAVAVSGGAVAGWTAVSATTARQWSRLAGQVDVVRNGVDLDRWRPGPGGGRLVWTGRLVREKAPHLAVRAAAMAGWGIDVAGPVGDVAYAEEHLWPLLGDGVRYLGHLEQNNLATLVGSAAAALVTPVWEEPFGLVAAEAAACGTPVVAFEQGGIAEVVVDGVTGVLVAPGGVEEMAAALPRAVRLDRSRVREVAERTLSLARTVDGYEAVYDAVLRGAGSVTLRRGRRVPHGWSSRSDATAQGDVTVRA